MNLLTAAALEAAEKPLTDNNVRPGLLGLFFFVALFVALYFLWRSMNKQLKKVDAHFAEVDRQEAAALAAETGSTPGPTPDPEPAATEPVGRADEQPDPAATES